jgi:S1-C subfamily serine protease
MRLSHLLLAALGLLLTSCTGMLNLPIPAGVNEQNSLRKQQLAGKASAEEKVLSVLASANLIEGTNPRLTITTKRSTKDGWTFHVKMKGDLCPRGTAVPISADGYFLTASHCLHKKTWLGEFEPLYLLYFTEGPQLKFRPARLVWYCPPRLMGRDLAVLKVELPPARHFPLVNPESLATGQRIVLGGWGSADGLTHNASPGKLLSVSELKRQSSSGLAWRNVRSDVPLCRGDSGGPLLAGNRLVGINVQRWSTFRELFGAWLPGKRENEPAASGGYTHTVAPDAAWLEALLERDRKAHPSR